MVGTNVASLFSVRAALGASARRLAGLLRRRPPDSQVRERVGAHSGYQPAVSGQILAERPEARTAGGLTELADAPNRDLLVLIAVASLPQRGTVPSLGTRRSSRP